MQHLALTGDSAGGAASARIGRALGSLTIGIGLLVSLAGDGWTGVVILVSGWFVLQGARVTERRQAIEELLAGVQVEQIMERDLPELAPTLTVDTFADQLLDHEERTTMPVVDGGSLVGVIGIGQLRRIGRRHWAELRAADIMVAPPILPSIGAADAAWEGLEMLRRSGLDGIPVMDWYNHACGLLTRRSRSSTRSSRGPRSQHGRPIEPAPARDRRVVGPPLRTRWRPCSARSGPLPAGGRRSPSAWLRALRSSPPPTCRRGTTAHGRYAVQAADTAGDGGIADPPRRDRRDRGWSRPALTVAPGTAVRIATGARIPAGRTQWGARRADDPIAEDGTAGPRGRSGQPLPSACLVHEPVKPGGSIRGRAGDLRAGSEVRRAGARMTPAAVAPRGRCGRSACHGHDARVSRCSPPGTRSARPGVARRRRHPGRERPGLRALVAALGWRGDRARDGGTSSPTSRAARAWPSGGRRRGRQAVACVGRAVRRRPRRLRGRRDGLALAVAVQPGAVPPSGRPSASGRRSRSSCSACPATPSRPR
jgi:CBS domain-containing protein